MKFIDYVDQKKNNGFDAWLDKKYGPKIEEADITELQTWETDSINLIKEIQEKSANWYDESTYQSMDSRLNTYLENADNWRKQYSGNNKITSYIDSVAETLSKAKSDFTDNYKIYSQYKSEDDYNTALKQWQEYYDAWGHYADEADFEEYSAKGAAIENPTRGDAEGGLNLFGWRPFAKEVGNIVTYSRDNYGLIAMDEAEGYDAVGDHRYHYMKDEEVAIYNYLLAKEGNDTAKKFLDSIEETLNARKGGQIAEKINAIDIPALEDIAKLSYGLGAGVDQFAGGVKQLFTSDKLPTSSTQYASAQIADSLDGFGKYAYSAATTIGNMAPSILVGTLNPVAGAATMGFSAAGNAYGQALDAGYSKLQARAYSTLVGASESALQYALGGITKLAGGTGKISAKVLSKINAIDESLFRISAKVGWETLKEIGEEELQNYLEPAFRTIIFGEEYDAPTMDELLETAIVTALSTGVLEGPTTIAGDVKNSRYYINTYGNVQRELVDQALEGGNLANPLSRKYQKKLDNGGRLTGHQIGRLVEANEQQFMAEDMAAIQTAAEVRLTELGETGDVSAIAAALAKMSNYLNKVKNAVNKLVAEGVSEDKAKKIANKEVNNPLTKTEQKAISDSKYGQRVANELNPDNINSEGYASGWAEQIDTHRINVQEYGRLLKAAQQPQETAEVTGKQVVTEMPKKAQAVQTAAVEVPVANDQQMASKLTGKESTVSDDGVTRQKSTDQAITPQKIVSIEGGKVMIQTDRGNIAADDIQFGTKETDLLWRSAADFHGINTAGANGIIRAYQSGTPVTTYLNGAAQEFRNGYYNMKSGGEHADKLTPTQRTIIYELGQKAAGAAVAKQQSGVKAADNGKAERRKGTVKGEGVTIADLKKTFNDTQGKAYKYLSTVAEVTGIDIVLYRSEADADGNFQGAQGRYSRCEPGTIYIDLNAGLSDIKSADDLAKYAMIRTFAHEFTHFIENWNPIQYNELRKVVFDTLTQRGENVSNLIEEKQTHNPGMDYDKASREVVAEAMTDILPDANFVQELAKNHKTIFQKLIGKLKEFVDNLRDYFNSIGHNPSREANALKEQVGETVKYLDSIVQLFDKVAVQAVENYQQSATTEGVIQEVKKHEEQREARKETREAFYGRAGEASFEVGERGALAFGYRRYSGQLSQNIREAEEGLKKIGIPVVVFEQMEGNKNGITTIYRNDALAIPGVAVFIHKDATVSALEIVGHEGYHYLATSRIRIDYREVVAANIDFVSKAFVDYQQKYVGDIYFAEDVEIGSKEWDTLIEEVFAYITGDIHAGDSRGEVQKFLRDYEAVKVAWDNLLGKMLSDNSVHNTADDADQNQQRTNTLTDRDILAIAKKRGITEMLSSGQVSALQIFNKKNAEIGELLKQKANLEKMLKDLQGAAKPNKSEIVKTRNRIKVIASQIDSESAQLRQYEAFDTVKDILAKVKPMVEQRLIEERKKELAKYATIPQGEKAARESKLPTTTDGKNKVSRTARTVKEAGVTPDDFAELIDKEVYLKDGLSYLPVSNNDVTQKAIDYITEEGWEAARGDWSAQVRSGKVSAELSAMGALLLNNAAKAGDKQTWLDVLYDYQIMSTNAGQAVQALRILKTLTPDDCLYMAHKSVNRMVKDLRLKREIQVDTELEAAYLAAETDEARDDIMAQIQQDVADQIPATFKDKWTSLRYLNMLGNLRTQVRNLAGNAVMGVTVEAKNLVAAGLETMATLCTGGKYQKNKALFASKDLMKAAFADYAIVKSIVSNGGKYNDQLVGSSDFAQGVMEKRKIFKSKVLEKYRKATNWAMENGDVPFSKYAYARALAGYLKQHGFDGSDLSKAGTKLMEDARQYAVQEAQEATFHDLNMLSKWVIKIGRRKDTPALVRGIADGVAPFRQTPANIAVRAEEYSPLGVINSLYYTVQAARENSDITPAQAINSWAKTITGSALFLLGSLLAAGGDLIGGPDDDEERDRFEQIYGQQNYALRFGDTYITIDWASPAAIPMLMGAQFYKLKEENGFQLNDITGALSSLADPMIEMSMMQGINDTLEKVRYSDNNLIQIAINSSLNYLTQGLTNSLVGQLERSFEDSRMSTYVDKSSQIPDWLQQQLGKASAKIPGWDYNQIPYINAWGEEQKNLDLTVNAIYNLLSPSYISKDTKDAVYEELMRLDDAQSDVNVIPNTPEKEYEGRYLSAEEYVALAKSQGQTQRRMIDDLIGSELYKTLPDRYKAKSVRFVYEYAKESAQIEVLGRKEYSSDWMAELQGDISEGIVKHVIQENIKGMFLAGDISADEAIQRRITYCGDSAEEAAEKVDYWKFQAANPDYADWSESTVTRFKDLDVETASHVVEVLDGLSPENGSTNVRTIQKLEAIAGDKTLLNQDKNAALRAIMDDKLEAKFDSALDMGISMNNFTLAYRKYLDTEGNGKKATVTAYYRKTFGISETKAEDLYDLFAGKK